MTEEVQLIYANRFAGMEKRRSQVWSVLTEQFFQRWVDSHDTVLDVGAGYCEFINNILAIEKYAMDLNPATSLRAGKNVRVITHDVSKPWPLADSSVNVVFSSNFLEHLPNKQVVQFCLQQAYRVLRPRGRVLLLGPNIRFCQNVYWDFFDHYVPLSDRSTVEALELCGFTIGKVIPKFLPFTMKGSVLSHPVLVRSYLSLPFAWSIFGKQFFIEAHKGQ